MSAVHIIPCALFTRYVVGGRTEHLIQKRPRAPFRGLWEFPGGKREAGESVRAALLREVHEELGITGAALLHFHAEARVELPGLGRAWLPLFSIVALDQTPEAREGQTLRWASLDEIAELPCVPSMRPFLRQLR